MLFLNLGLSKGLSIFDNGKLEIKENYNVNETN